MCHIYYFKHDVTLKKNMTLRNSVRFVVSLRICRNPRSAFLSFFCFLLLCVCYCLVVFFCLYFLSVCCYCFLVFFVFCFVVVVFCFFVCLLLLFFWGLFVCVFY